MKKQQSSAPVPPSKAPSATDVARLAGVSRTQVSYVLSNTSSTHVSPEKRERILAAAKELGYRPHHMAQSLRRGFSSEFSIFFPAPYTSRISGIISTIHADGLAGGCVVTQYSWNRFQDPERRLETFQAMLARRPRGIFCSLLDLDRSYIDMAREQGVERILVLDVEEHDEFATFYLPIESVGRLAAEHLIERGHRRVAIVKPADPAQKRPFKLRQRGMKRVFSTVSGASIETLDWPDDDIVPSLAAAREAASSFMAMSPRPSAIYAYSDDHAFALMRALREHGLKVPLDIAVLGTDDLPYSEQFTPSLSTIRFDEAALGKRAVALINSLITGDPLDERFMQAPIPYLVIREST